MKNKYNKLIKSLMQDPRTKIFSESPNSILLGLENMGGKTTFNLIRSKENLKTQWKVDSPIFGEHLINWDFPENSNQDQMFERIQTDIVEYNKTIL
jgi:hypothetical protein